MSTDEHKRRERAQVIGLFRYQLICPALEAGLSTKQRGKLVGGIAARAHTDPFGNRVRYSRDTLDRWIRRWRAGGFTELVPSPRRPAARTDQVVLDLAAALKRESPARTAAQVARILRASTGWAPSESTLLRHFHRLELIGPAAGQPGEVFGRFEAENPNELWCGDALHGPRVGGRKTYLFAFLDDHSRLLTGYRFGYAEDAVRLAVALQPALSARGVPAGVYVDNGSAYVDAWLLRACAKLGVRLVHSTPGRPQGRGKIERFFRTVRDQFLVEVTDSSAEDLAKSGVDHAAALLELNRLFTAWVETAYHCSVHSETGQRPMDRWEAGWDRLGRTPACCPPVSRPACATARPTCCATPTAASSPKPKDAPLSPNATPCHPKSAPPGARSPATGIHDGTSGTSGPRQESLSAPRRRPFHNQHESHTVSSQHLTSVENSTARR